ncbi:hypothetical protein [Halocynthiibacter styelae]|uniref:Uncharacterized protein n=1 Tax=Halocynthiibacter styelae TaxID=2761955 RepID=A0A8J7J7X8_9RHOB|nr:hypothetical protein [Paenihalocynthiibacter styelae]MBI1494880.1 hypothetical protein [Paenihalocynthiibacter styelae]
MAVEALAASTFSGNGNGGFVGAPLMHNLGLAAELTFKTLLLQNGFGLKSLRKFGHDLLLNYNATAPFLDQTAFEAQIVKEAQKHQPDQPIFDRRTSFTEELKTLNVSYYENSERDGHRFLTRYPDLTKTRPICHTAIIHHGLVLILDNKIVQTQ